MRLFIRLLFHFSMEIGFRAECRAPHVKSPRKTTMVGAPLPLHAPIVTPVRHDFRRQDAAGFRVSAVGAKSNSGSSSATSIRCTRRMFVCTFCKPAATAGSLSLRCPAGLSSALPGIA